MRSAIACVLVFSSWIAGAARADVVDPPPSDCPPGSSPSTSHSGPYCAPTAECTSDSACGAGSACDAQSQCIETRDCGGLTLPDSEPCTLEHVAGPCNADGTCDVGTCRSRDVCTDGSTTAGGCGCTAAGGGSRGGLAMLALAALFFARRRRA